MQARIHIRGYAMRKAEQLEQQGMTQYVYMSYTLMIFNNLVTKQIRKYLSMTLNQFMPILQ